MLVQVDEGGDFDLVRDFWTPLPVMAEMAGVESERYRDFKRWSEHRARYQRGRCAG